MKKSFIVIIFAVVILVTGCTSNKNEEQVILKDIDPNERVIIKDEELEKIIRNTIVIPTGEILASDMEELERINIDYSKTPVQNIEGLEYAVNLNSFSFRNGGVLKSLTPISNLQELEYLNVSYAEVDEMVVDFNTPKLQRVSFAQAKLLNLDFLKTAVDLREIYISNSGLDNIDFVIKMEYLESITIINNTVSDIQSLEKKLTLTYVNIQGNEVSDISLLTTCTSLEYLNISYNLINNIDPLYSLTNLKSLTAYEIIANKKIPESQFKKLEASGVSVQYHK